MQRGNRRARSADLLQVHPQRAVRRNRLPGEDPVLEMPVASRHPQVFDVAGLEVRLALPVLVHVGLEAVVEQGTLSSVCQRSGLCSSSGRSVEACEIPCPPMPHAVKRTCPFSRRVSSVVRFGRMP